MEKRIFTTGEVAKMCDVTVVTVNKWFDAGRLKGYRMPGSNRRRIPYASLVEFLKENNMPIDRLKEFKERTILVVDDEEDTRNSLIAILKDKFPGFRVESAGNGFEACLKAGRLQPELVILDIFMPGMNGFEVCRALAAGDSASRPKILGITGLPDEGTPAQLLECGADDCLVKPVEPPQFLEKARKLLRIRVFA